MWTWVAEKQSQSNWHLHGGTVSKNLPCTGLSSKRTGVVQTWSICLICAASECLWK